MASSKRLRPDELAAHVATILQRHQPSRRRVALALSGGLDSVVLFHLLLSLRELLGFQFSALHVHHGLSPKADGWETFCAELCARNQVPFDAQRVAVFRSAGRSLEAAAREARYGVFASSSTDLLLLAQHLDDQAETLLLQMLRGAGAKGLAAMPEARQESAGKTLLRPLLEVPRGTLQEYAETHGLVWVDDESNADVSFDRNFLRHRIFPVLERRFPAYRQTLGRASRHMAEAAQLMDDLAQLDGADSIRDGLLEAARLLALSPQRAKNLLRYHLVQNGIPLPDTSRLEEALRQLRDAPDAQVRIRFADYEIRSYRGWVEAARHVPAFPADLNVRWNGEAEVALPGICLRFEAVTGMGIQMNALSSQTVTVRSRQGGEHFRPLCGRPSRSLKNLLQEAGIPPWRRAHLPLLFAGDDLVWVPGIGIDCAYQAQAGEAGWAIQVLNPA